MWAEMNMEVRMSADKPLGRLIALATGLVLSLSLFAARADDSPGIFAIGRYTLPTNRFHDLGDHVESLEPGGIKYDREFRHPHLPPGPVVIDCQKTHRIGVTLAVTSPPEPERTSVGPQGKSPSAWAKRLKVRYHWTHSEDEALSRSHYVEPDFFSNGHILSSGMTLTKKRRVDGTWNIRVTHEGEEIYRTSFELVRCPAANAS